jgi:GNAT superfamily N-acetyltransferase
MAPSEAPAIERLGADAIAGGLALSDAAGWNQTEDDWALFVAAGHVFGLRDGAGRLVASGAALPYDGAVGWISMMLVDAGHRHRGLATRLLAACIDALHRAGRASMLDATPAGAEVYRRSGFAAGFGFERWEGEGIADEGAAGAAVEVDVREPARLAAFGALDRSVGGVGREVLWRSFAARPATRAWLSADASGFVVARPGRRATQIGPLVAADEAAALALAKAALAGTGGRVFIDVPTHQAALQQALARRGFARQRPFVRMASVATSALAASARLFAVAGPEFG